MPLAPFLCTLIALSTLSALQASAPSPAAPGPSAPAASGGLRLVTEVSFTANLVHWVDNLAGTSVGKTMAVYRDHWADRFGPLDRADRQALEQFARVRRAPVRTPAAVANHAGCLPIEEEVLSWHQILLAQAMKASSIEALAASLAAWIGPEDRQALAAALLHFKPRFEKVWREMGHVRRFQRVFERFLGDSGLIPYLESLARFFGVDAAAAPPMTISLMALPSNGPTHAEADGDHLLVEIRPLDLPRNQIQVVAHEASHFLMRRMSPGRVDALARQAHAEGEAGSLVWRYMWEGLPTALGQGLAEARLSPATFSTGARWYHLPQIDRFAKLAYPGVAEAVTSSAGIEAGIMGSLARAVRGSSLFTDARPAEFLMTAVSVSSAELRPSMDRLWARARVRPFAETALGDEGAAEMAALMQRYECLGGVALVLPGQVREAAALAGPGAVSSQLVEESLEKLGRGRGVILTTRRPGGGPLFLLATPGAAEAERLVEAFLALRSLPSAPIEVGPAPPAR
ncbi:MAG TPA: hypothetical protein VJV23_04010 [Candidatus Polarisedimenticolia bacterium]|nr:hypothetical protein [Candidatus Polarisedimenticolia bacterium]